MKPRWDVVWVGYSNYYGMGGEFERPPHRPHEKGRRSYRTYLAADWARRFSRSTRSMTASLGTFKTITAIVPTGRALEVDEAGAALEPDPAGPRYANVLEMAVWPVFYFVRSRWDGLRWGRDRDSF